MFGLDVVLTLWLALGGASAPAALPAGPGMDFDGLSTPLAAAGQADQDAGPGMDPSG